MAQEGIQIVVDAASDSELQRTSSLPDFLAPSLSGCGRDRLMDFLDMDWETRSRRLDLSSASRSSCPDLFSLHRIFSINPVARDRKSIDNLIYSKPTPSTVEFLATLREKEDLRRGLEEHARQKQIDASTSQYYNCMLIISLVAPLLIIFSGVLLSTVCQGFKDLRDLYIEGECTVTGYGFRNYSEPCLCGHCYGRETVACYTSYPCFMVHVQYHTSRPDLLALQTGGNITEGVLGGSNRSTSCAYDMLSPCYEEGYLNDYEIQEFAVQYSTIGKMVPCYFSARNLSYFYLPEEIPHVPGGILANCYFWPGTVFVLSWICLPFAAVELLRGRASQQKCMSLQDCLCAEVKREKSRDSAPYVPFAPVPVPKKKRRSKGLSIFPVLSKRNVKMEIKPTE